MRDGRLGAQPIIGPSIPQPPTSSKTLYSPGWEVMGTNQGNHCWNSIELACLNLLPDAAQQLTDLLF